MKIASWNVNGIRARVEHVKHWLTISRPDVLALQETKVVDDLFPFDAFESIGYQAVVFGQKAYNGVALLTKNKAPNITRGMDGYQDEQARVISADYKGIRIIDVYVPNGQSVGSEKFAYKIEWFSHLHRLIKQSFQANKNLVVLGDFNIAPEDMDAYDPEAWKDKVLCSDQERTCLRSLLSLGLSDSFRLFEQPEEQYSWWDYRAAAYRRKMGLRIDLILLSDPVSKHCVSSTIDESPRVWEKPSDHIPVLVEIDIG